MDDVFDLWAPRLEDATMAAAREWVAGVPVFPTLTAAGEQPPEDPEHFDLGALLLAASAWATIADRRLLPVLLAALLDQTGTTLRARGIPADTVAGLPPAPAGLLGELRDALAEAERLLADAGRAGEHTAAVIGSATWIDFIDSYAAATRNLVAGMPDGVYREMVEHLAVMARHGDTGFERARWVREFLDVDGEGGYAAWMRRARRIARTETQRAVQASTLRAARMEQDLYDEALDKAWVCTLDARTRDSHFAADGQRVPLDGRFLLDGHECDHPGDPALPAHECINCRCAVLILGADEPLPGDEDRQTERERADGTRRDPMGEVARRAADGVTRARDDAGQHITAAGQETPMRTQWTGLLAPIGAPTGDGRIIDDDATLDFRDMPLPLLWQKATSGGHDAAVIVGKITSATADAGGVQAAGELLDTPEAMEARDLIAEGVIRPSVDMCDLVAEWELLDADGKPVSEDDWERVEQEVMHVRSATIMAATLVATPAFGEATIRLGEEVPAPDEDDTASLVAAAAVVTTPAVEPAPAEAFEDPGLEGPTALTVTDDGRVFGHLALWGTEHVGMPGRRVTPPHSATDYSFFHVSTVESTRGPVAVGRLTVGCGHATADAAGPAATAHYDDAGTCWALVRAGEDAHGIWVAGVVNPDADPETVRAGASAPLSGDWRSIGGHLELVAALSVNTPGFPVPRSFQVRQEPMSLVAAGVVRRSTAHDRLVAAVLDALDRRDRDRREAEATARRATEARALAAALLAREVRR